MKPRIHFKADKDLISAIAVGVLGSVVALAMFFLSGYMVTQSALGAPLFALMILIVSVKLFGFLRAIFRYAERLLSHRTTFTMLRDVRVQFFKGLIPVIPDVYRRFKSTELLSNMVSRIEALQNIYLRVYYPPVVIGITTIISIIVMFAFSYIHALIIFVSMFITLGIVPWLSAKRATKIKAYKNKKQNEFLNHFYDYKAGYAELQRFEQQHNYKMMLDNSLTAYSKAQLKEQRFLTLYDFILNIISMLALFFTLYLGVVQVQEQQFDVVYLTSIVLMMLTLFEQAVPMSNVAYYKADTDDALSKVNEVMAHPITQGTERFLYDASHPIKLSVQNVDFKYWNQSVPVLRNINLEVAEGEHVALIGPSGSGKSTILQLMLGLYQAEAGEIKLNNQQLHNITNEDKYKMLNGMLQTQQVFDGTLKENLFTSQPDSVIKETLVKLGLDHFALNTPLTLVGDTVSGGELQRIGIARLLLNNKPIWILDEPTTALDIYHTERVMDLIHKYAQTLVIATHDLRLLPQFDKIVVVVDGEIIEAGSYEDLLAQRGYLYQIMTLNKSV
ncbi:amino acid ABC transporter ATP-binding/permease protein [Staphylococcus arlettae]|uniref:amino acid ABC transporter ATP-binding/permease protein n=1 Tax=Staphylococcus arlettae TaxID=29378 RepID=UPI000D1A5421|nr:amino acid ABC transporter ATP-binding/permease protein [Staphylococcus arlettae]PUZ33445.1 amino acid ABC transporter ATP-binding/permease protein [Staphylococcus arlettae]RIM57288.1 amino acid ABC transporter ATP-binding/permease protein [Staphylococcus arlettae]